MTSRHPARAHDAEGKHIGPGPWLTLIRICNELAPETFGAPTSTGPWWAGGSVEEYPTMRVLHREDDTVSIHGKTEAATALLERAEELLRDRWAQIEQSRAKVLGT
jgi:hypothetical protein